MKNKIFSSLVVALIIISFGSVSVGMNVSKNSKKLNGVVDQSQDRCEEAFLISEYAWQEFVPIGQNLLSVNVKICHWSLFSPNLLLSIEKPLGNILSFVDVEVQSVPWEHCNWVTFDFEDIEVTPGENYYIVLSHEPNGYYGWCGAWNNLYKDGESNLDPQWDWCFRTIADKSRTKEIQNFEYELLYQILLKFFKGGTPLFRVEK